MTEGRETVVVTGLGATTPLGGDVASTWSAMLAGRSGVHSLSQPWAESLPVRFAAEAAADPVEVVGRVQARRMDRCEQFALVAAREALGCLPSLIDAPPIQALLSAMGL